MPHSSYPFRTHLTWPKPELFNFPSFTFFFFMIISTILCHADILLVYIISSLVLLGATIVLVPAHKNSYIYLSTLHKPFLKKLIFTVMNKKWDWYYDCPPLSFHFKIIILTLWAAIFSHHLFLSKHLCTKFMQPPTCIITSIIAIWEKKKAATIIPKYFMFSLYHIIYFLMKFFWFKIFSCHALDWLRIEGTKIWGEII